MKKDEQLNNFLTRIRKSFELDRDVKFALFFGNKVTHLNPAILLVDKFNRYGIDRSSIHR